MAVHFLADLHLPTGASAFREQFCAYLSGPAREAEAVYLLGDLFEVWLGDDIGLDDYQAEVQALRVLRQSGVPVYLQRGNRDFLLGKRFCEATGVQRLPDPHRIDLYGVPTLISHGDQWCTDDVGYQRWRRFAHHPLPQRIFQAMPRSWRERIATKLRARSQQHKQLKAAAIMDVHPQAIGKAIQESGALQIIHGHTHRPAEHDIPGPEAARRVVLADWRPDRMEVLVLGDGGYERQNLLTTAHHPA